MKKLFLICLCVAPSMLFAQGLSSMFPITQDIKVGEEVAKQVESDPKNKILDEKKNPEAYKHLRRITDAILNSGKVKYQKEFKWQVKIIHNDSVLNAFCAPGGFIYVYTGLIKYLDNEDQLAGVLGHEIAHADRRHSMDNLAKAQGLNAASQLLLGKKAANGMVANMAKNFLGLGFSRESERDADEYSVVYLCGTSYQSNGAAGFFEKMLREQKGAKMPAWFSTHPASDERVKNINASATAKQCSVVPSKTTALYQAFKNSLPK